jgi:hypothetical protein
VRNGGFVAVQTESEPEVRSLLDDLGLREKQQFVRVFYFVHSNLLLVRCHARVEIFVLICLAQCLRLLTARL